MSFVQRLRMANMFPIRSDLGNARIDTSGRDPMNDIIEIGRHLNSSAPNIIPPAGGMGLRNNGVSNKLPQQKLQFGGVVGPQSNPGGDILSRASSNAERIWDSYRQPVNAPFEGGPSNDEMHYQRYLDNALKSRTVDSNIAQNERRMTNEERRLANEDKRIAQGDKRLEEGDYQIINITDPNDPTKQINARYNKKTNQVEPINLDGGVITRPGSAKDIQTRIDNETKGAANRKAYLDKTNESLSVLNDILDPKTDKLTPEGGRAVGGTSLFNFIPTTKGYSGSLKINKLKSEQVLNLIKELKEQSRTGATGMGNMSNKDLGVIEKAASLLNTGLDEEEFTKQIKIVRTELQDIVNRLNSGNETSANNSSQIPAGKIRVRNKATGQTGMMSEGAFNPEKYERIQ